MTTMMRITLALLVGAALAAPSAASASERKPGESYADCKRRISSVPPCSTKWTIECARRCGFSY